KELVKNFALDLEFDVVHAHDWMTFLAALEVRNVTGKKCVLHVHATEIDRTADNPHELIFNIEKYVLNEADKVIAISEYIKNTLIERYGVDSSKIEVIHNALSSEHTHDINYSLNISKGKTVMFLGRAVVQKGVETFIQIAKRVLEKLPDTTFIFAGDGPLLPYVIDKVCQLGIQDNVIFAGSVDRYEGDVLFSTADLYLMTSISEPFGITALEAINQGTPVIITKTSGANEVLPNALKADFWDIDKFADFTVNILQDEILYEELLENQRKDFSKLTWKNQVEKMIGIYSTLINSYEDNSIV
ncbi:MAG TPA: glycosyltransferase family 4 protein, partial [Candidatus Dojkabacteria bacterium]